MGDHGAMIAHDGANDYVYFQYFDAFGVPVDRQTSAPVEEAAEYNWRGREGSESDVSDLMSNPPSQDAADLVYMQARSYALELQQPVERRVARAFRPRSHGLETRAIRFSTGCYSSALIRVSARGRLRM
jgi:hypothetical protein